MSINIAIVGVGNCCSSLYQGFTYYGNNRTNTNGIMREQIGGYGINNINVVAAFDIDERKVGKTLKSAIVSKPNCTPMFADYDKIPDGPTVMMGNLLDGVSDHMLDVPEDNGFRVSRKKCDDIKDILISKKVDILINYLPVGSQMATEYYANCC